MPWYLHGYDRDFKGYLRGIFPIELLAVFIPIGVPCTDT